METTRRTKLVRFINIDSDHENAKATRSSGRSARLKKKRAIRREIKAARNKATPNVEVMADKKDCHFGLKLHSVDGRRLRTAYLSYNPDGNTSYWLMQLLTQSMETNRLGHHRANSELGHFLHSAEIQHLFALYLNLLPAGTTLSWLSLLLYQSFEVARLKIVQQKRFAPAMGKDDDDDDDSDVIIMPLPSGTTPSCEEQDNESSSTGSNNSSNDGSSNGQHTVGPSHEDEDGVLASLPMFLTSVLGEDMESELISNDSIVLTCQEQQEGNCSDADPEDVKNADYMSPSHITCMEE